MKAVILAGGLGTRLSEETSVRPKPMVEIGGRPILWHILKMYSHYGVNDFVICVGYKGYLIKEYFANYVLHLSDVTFDMEDGSMVVHQKRSEPWRVTVVDTGEDTMTGGRLKRAQPYLDDEDFCFTYGDGVADIDIRSLIDFHRENDRLATLTGVQPPERFGVLGIQGSQVVSFQEKPEGEGSWVSGGFFVLNPSVLERISGDACIWERGPLESLASEGQLGVYRHDGFWRPMDTLRDKVILENMWEQGEAPWKKW